MQLYLVQISSPSTHEVITVSIGIHLPGVLCTVYVPSNSSDDYHASLLNYLTVRRNVKEMKFEQGKVASTIISSPPPRDLLSLRKIETFLYLIVEDFNLPEINWSSLIGLSSSSKFCEFVFDNNLIQHVDSPTHVKGNILDIVVSNTSTVSDISANQLLISDHFIIGFKIEFSL